MLCIYRAALKSEIGEFITDYYKVRIFIFYLFVVLNYSFSVWSTNNASSVYEPKSRQDKEGVGS